MNKTLPENILIIRADASSNIGTGHIMRCLALAAAWKDPQNIYIVSAGLPLALRKIIEESAYNIIDIEAAHPAPQDLNTMRQLLAEHQAYVVLDGYHFDLAYQKEIKRLAGRCMLIDDYQHLNEYDCDILLNQNVGSALLNYNTNPNCRMLLGPHNVLLRQEFLSLLKNGQSRTRVIKPQAKRILLNMGGADSANMTLEVLTKLEALEQSLEIDIVLGAANQHLQSITDFAQHSKHHSKYHSKHQSKHRCQVLQNVNSMLTLMNNADLAISAGGSTCWELCFTGLPFLVCSIASNQDKIIKILHNRNVAMMWSKPEELLTLLPELLEDQEQRQAMSLKGQKLVDGLGVYRAISALRGDDGYLLPATKQYCETLWDISNDNFARKMSVIQIPISLESFNPWFEERLSNKKEPIFFFETPNNEIIGYASFEKFSQTQEPTIRLCLDKQWRGKGLALLLFRYACRDFFRNVGSAKSLDALLYSSTSSVYSVLVKLGFEKVATIKHNDKDVYVLRLNRENFSF